MPRPREISDDMNPNPKRRRLNCKSSDEEQLYLQSVFPPLDEQQKFRSAIHQDQAEDTVYGNLSQLSDCDASQSDGDQERCVHDRLSECCYGMLPEIQLRLRHSSNPSDITNVPLSFRIPNLLVSPADNSLELEIQSAVYAKILTELVALEDVKLQLCCYSRLELPCPSRTQLSRRRNGQPFCVWRLNVIIYGTLALEQVIGRYLSRNRAYLQDPVDCQWIVLYKNPHMIQGRENTMTDSFTSRAHNIEIERITVGPDLLAQLMAEQTDLPQTEPPSIVTTSLFRHQKQALTFMLRREQGWDMEGSQDVWTKQEHYQGLFKYHNNINGSVQLNHPPSFRGGLLADDMGLGKTLSMISLIAMDQLHRSESNSAYSKTNSTLLIVPPPLIQAWEKQFKMHIFQDALKLHVYHGQSRKRIQYLQQHNVVITTYQTLSSAWKKQNCNGISDALFSVEWHRVILDEAHVIQNAQSQQAQACCALRAERRWAITGTPIQNKLTDFASILKFLNVYPYSDQRVFDEEISRPWHQVDPEGFFRLKTLVRAITISRSKTVIDLPARVDEIHRLEFSVEERNAYKSANKDTIALFEDAISSDRQGGKTFNALARLNFLRVFCNLGLSAYGQQTSPPSSAPRASVYSGNPDNQLDGILDGSTCAQCGQALLEDILEGLPSSDMELVPHTSDALQICSNCRTNLPYDQAPYSTPERSVSSTASACSTPRHETQNFLSAESIPTKIKTLVADLSRNCSDEKSVVFSFWTSTLDLVQEILNHGGIAHSRIDGKTSLAKRSEAMYSFQTNNNVRVILVSITCGEAGLDLTAGSRVYLLEPHWNPMVEEQALCRVHRVGQTRNVTTIRYLMRNSFEEQVVEIQKRKKKLVEVTFGSAQLPENGIGIGTLKYLKSVLE